MQESVWLLKLCIVEPKNYLLHFLVSENTAVIFQFMQIAPILEILFLGAFTGQANCSQGAEKLTSRLHSADWHCNSALDCKNGDFGAQHLVASWNHALPQNHGHQHTQRCKMRRMKTLQLKVDWHSI